MQAFHSPFYRSTFKTVSKDHSIGGFSGVVDAIGASIAAGYSLRRLTKNYAGKCVNVRRSSDSSAIDVGFTSSGDFDQTAYASHCGTNFLLNTATLSTQSVTVVPATYVLSFQGTGTVALSGTSTAGPLVGDGVSNRVSLSFTPTAGSLTLTVSGSVTSAQLEFGATATTYEARTGTAASIGYVPRWDDQSGSGRHATQSKALNQPMILPRQYGEKPMMGFLAASSQYFNIASVIDPTTFCLASVGNAYSSSTFYPCCILGYPAHYYRLDTDTWGIYLNANVDTAFAIVAKASSMINVRAPNDVDLVFNGTKTVKTNGSGFYSRASAFIGFDSANYLNGMTGEILLTDVLSSGQATSLNANHQAYWGTP